MAERPLVTAAAARPYPGETVSGDAWAEDCHDGIYRLMVIDGLGHGPQAAAAAEAARAVFVAHPALGPAEVLRACHTALVGTRGAAIWVGQIDLAARRLTFAGAGNVEAHLWQGQRPRRLVAQRGVVGAALPSLRAFDWALDEAWVLLVHTDGVRERFEADMPPSIFCEDLQSLVQGLLLAWARSTDDALIVAVRPAA